MSSSAAAAAGLNETFPTPLPLWVSAVVTYPGVLQPLNIFGSVPLRMIKNVLELPHHQRYFFMALPASQNDPPGLRLVGTVVRVEKLHDNGTTRVSLLVKGIKRGLLMQRVPLQGDSGAFEGAEIQVLEDQPTENVKELEDQVEKLLRLIDRFNQRYETNSLWKVITQRAGAIPKGNPELLSFWALSCLPPSVTVDIRARLLRSLSTIDRLKFVSSSPMFKRKDVASFSPNRDEGHDTMAADDTLATKCIESICENLTPKNRKDMKYLPVELMDRVFTHLKQIDRLSLENLISLKHCSVETLNLSGLPKLSDEWLKIISKFYLNVTYLDLSFGYAISDASVSECLQNLKNLRVVILDGCKRLTDEGLRPLAECKELIRIRLNGTRVTTTTIKKLRGLPQLSHLALSGTRFPDLGIFILVGMSSEEIKAFVDEEAKIQRANEEAEQQGLQEISPPEPMEVVAPPPPPPMANAPPPPGPPPALDKVYHIFPKEDQELFHTDPIPLDSLHLAETKITSVGCKKLPMLKGLTELNISFNQRVTEWAFLAQMPLLAYLDMSMNAGFESQHARYLAGLANLRYLDISKTELADDGLPPLFKLTNLECLRLGGTKVSDFLGTGVHNWPKLQILHLQYTNVTAAVVESLRALPRLTALKFTGCFNFLDDGLQTLADPAFANLEHLDLGTRNITDAALTNVGVLTSLRTLNLWNTKVTLNGAEIVKRLTNLVLDESMNTTWGTFLFVRR